MFESWGKILQQIAARDPGGPLVGGVKEVGGGMRKRSPDWRLLRIAARRHDVDSS